MYPLEKRLAVLLDIQAKIPYKVLTWKHGIASGTVTLWKNGLGFGLGTYTIVICKRCGVKFDYIQKVGTPRKVCDACKPLQRKDSLKASYRKQQGKRNKK